MTVELDQTFGLNVLSGRRAGLHSSNLLNAPEQSYRYDELQKLVFPVDQEQREGKIVEEGEGGDTHSSACAASGKSGGLAVRNDLLFAFSRALTFLR